MSIITTLAGWFRPAPPLAPAAPAKVAMPVAAVGDKPGRAIARGERNNNWGNIDYNPANQWEGQVGLEMPPLNGGRPRFAVFRTPEHGIRAILRLLDSYQRKYGLLTVRGMINRWAPPNENSTGAYVAFVAGRMGLLPDVPVDLSDKAMAKRIVTAIVAKELGYLPPNADAVIDAGVRLANL